MEHEQRQGAVERTVLEGQVASICLPDLDARVAVALDRRLHKDGRVVDCDDLPEFGRPREREGQAAVAAADVDNPFAGGKPGEIDEQGRELPAPAAHELLIGGRIVDIEA